jgi:hypothetical protein
MATPYLELHDEYAGGESCSPFSLLLLATDDLLTKNPPVDGSKIIELPQHAELHRSRPVGFTYHTCQVTGTAT